MKRIGCILLISTIILTGCKTGNKNKNDKENKTAVENRFEKKNENIENVKKESSGQISFGYLNEKKDVYEYNGKEVRKTKIYSWWHTPFLYLYRGGSVAH